MIWIFTETSLVFLNLWFLLKHTSLKERQLNSCFYLLNSITWLMSVLRGTSSLSNKPAQCCTNWRRTKQSQGVLPGAWGNMDNPHRSSPKDAHSKECNNSTWRSRGKKKPKHKCWRFAESAVHLYRSVRWGKPVLSSLLPDIFNNKSCIGTFRKTSFLKEKVLYFPANVTPRRKLRNPTERR